MKKYRCKETIIVYDDDAIFDEREIEKDKIFTIHLFCGNIVWLNDSNNKRFSIGYLVFKDYFEEVKE